MWPGAAKFIATKPSPFAADMKQRGIAATIQAPQPMFVTSSRQEPQNCLQLPPL